MRIISGLARGMRLATPTEKSIRPTSDRSKEALFSILGCKITGAAIADLFAGTGALGLEAMSRGGASCLFVDNGTHALSLIRKNISLFSSYTSLAASSCRVVKADLKRNFHALTTSLPAQGCFDIIFLDPPYDKDIAKNTLLALDTHRFLAKDGLIIAEERAKRDLPTLLENLQLRDTRHYGDTGFWIYGTK